MFSKRNALKKAFIEVLFLFVAWCVTKVSSHVTGGLIFISRLSNTQWRHIPVDEIFSASMLYVMKSCSDTPWFVGGKKILRRL